MKESEIESCLVELAELLKTYQRKYYANQVAGLASDLQRAQGYPGYTRRILYEIQDLYGGMGSLSDIFITDKAGDPILPDETFSVNNRLQQLRSRLYELVVQEINLIESQVEKK